MKNKLKILLGNNTLSLLAGSETWTLTLALELKKKGHEVFAYSPSLGIIAEEMEKAGIRAFKEISSSKIKPFSFILEEEVDHKYDVIIANHNQIVSFLRGQFPKTPIISTIHGIIHKVGDDLAPEHPALSSGVNQFVAVSEEVKEKLWNDYHLESVIVRNFFDVFKYETKRPISPSPRQFLINSNYSDLKDPALLVIKEVAKHYGAKVTAIGENFNPTFNIQKALEDADVVFGMGRSVLEGVAAGRLGIVHGRWGTGGAIAEENISELRHYNFSGRNSKGLGTAGDIISMIDRHYNQGTVEWGKKYIRLEHNAALAADTYLALARELLGGEMTPKNFQPGQSGNPGMPKLKFANAR